MSSINNPKLKLDPVIEFNRSNSVSPRHVGTGIENGDSSEEQDTAPEPTTPVNNQYLSHSWHHFTENDHTKVGNGGGSPLAGRFNIPVKIKSASLVPLQPGSEPPQPKLIASRSQPGSRRGSVGSDSNLRRFTKTYLIPAAKWAYSPLNKSKKQIPQEEEYVIEYSTFRPLRNLQQLNSNKDILVHWKRTVEQETNQPFDFPDNYLSDRDFQLLLNHIIEVIEVDHKFPDRIVQGSSGSYFVYGGKTDEYSKAAIFKPKDEEPYGPLSPKWSKWAHRTFFPCCFGRSCLIPNLGYISEAAACYLDKQLQSYIVPYTEVVCLRSPTFFYSYWDKNNDVSKLPQKIGSFQLFLQGYSEAEVWIRQNPIPSDHETIANLSKNSDIEVDIDVTEYIFKWSIESMRQFQEEVEKLVILDYIMRNTDRGLDNWMIRVDWIQVECSKNKKTMKPKIRIGAIDSGLAFPWKHPDEWRSFPFGWLFLPYSIIGQPFSMNTRNHYLPLLTSKIWWEETVKKLRQVFSKDQDFKERLWHKQLAVLKGQAFNVVEILKLGYAGPLELTKRENLLVFDDMMYMPENIDSANDGGMFFGMQTSMYETDTSRQYQDDIYTPLLPGQNNNLSNSLGAINEDDVNNESGYEHINREQSDESL
ncbi:Phosphatidylinositol 4-kinase LSB6 [Spathaspora sp. JA1]|nr:Phosphatidylinositol 4-kinase LSB6 [Spathaspora sp. JA1]